MKANAGGDMSRRAGSSTGQIHDPWQISSDDFPHDGSAEEKLWFAVNYAVLAPSTHNTQPWRFRIHGLEVDLHADPGTCPARRRS